MIISKLILLSMMIHLRSFWSWALIGLISLRDLLDRLRTNGSSIWFRERMKKTHYCTKLIPTQKRCSSSRVDSSRLFIQQIKVKKSLSLNVSIEVVLLIIIHFWWMMGLILMLSARPRSLSFMLILTLLILWEISMVNLMMLSKTKKEFFSTQTPKNQHSITSLEIHTATPVT